MTKKEYKTGKRMGKLNLSDKMIDLVARRFRALGEPMRLRILQTIAGGERSVGEIVQAVAANQSNVSKHLQELHEAGVVSRRPEGTLVYYAIADPVVFKLCDMVCSSAAAAAREQALAFDGASVIRAAPKATAKTARKRGRTHATR